MSTPEKATGAEKPIGIAVLGLGNVGSEVVRIIEDSAADLAARIGAPLELRGGAVRRVADDRGVPVAILTAYYQSHGGWTAASPATLYIWTSVTPVASLLLFGLLVREATEPAGG